MDKILVIWYFTSLSRWEDDGEWILRH